MSIRKQTEVKDIPSKIVRLFINEVGEEKVYNWFYEPGIKEHDLGTCNCDLTDGGYGLCYVGQCLEGDFTPMKQLKENYDILEDMLIEEMETRGIKNLIIEIDSY